MLRVTSGKAKNKKLRSPNIPKFQAVQEVAKLAVFSIIGEKVLDALCLDLFAGSGNMGIEALSRGARWCDFVDENRKAVDKINSNLTQTGFEGQADVYQQEAVKFVANAPQKYDLIFADPFYKDVKHKYLLELLQDTLNKKGIIVFFHGENLDMKDLLEDTSFRIADSRRYGKSYVDFLVFSS